MSTSPSGQWTARSIDDAAWPDFLSVDAHAFGMTTPPELLETIAETHERARDIGVYDGELLAGIATAYSFDLSIPGGSLPAAGVSWVGVLPTHRRRGILGTLMRHQLTGLHDDGREPLAVLWASEPPIYGRFGYGPATHRREMTVRRSPAALVAGAPSDAGLRLRLADASDTGAFRAVHDTVVADRPGGFTRPDSWWARTVRDLPVMREGRSELRCVLAEDASGVRGYALYFTKQAFGEDFADGEVTVREVMALDPAALATLYRYLFDLDLMGRTSFWNVPVDDPLVHWLANPRMARQRPGDALYVRLVGVGEALAARTYSADLDLVLDVTDGTCPWNAGRWHLSGGPGGATCERTGAAADLTLDVRELGAAYLGGTALVELAAAGLVHGADPAVRAASVAFAHHPAPWCPMVF